MHDPRHNDNGRDPEFIAKTVRATWAASRFLAEYRAAQSETPLEALERRVERLEAAVYAIAERLKDVAA